MTKLKFALIGTGFWAQYQLAGWKEIDGAECVAVCDLSLEKAEDIGRRFSISNIYDDINALLLSRELDFVDIVTDVDSHSPLAMAAIERGVAVVCQKPLAPSLEIAQEMCRQARSWRVPLLVHENWRWQRPLRRLKEIIDSGVLGTLVRGRIDYANSFPVFDNQPFLKPLERFILTDIGTHILDVSRFLFGEAEELYCQTRKIHENICGEDVATVLMRKRSGLTVTCNMSYASRWEFDRFPQTMVSIEGTTAGVALGRDFEITVYEDGRANCERVHIPDYPWANPEYALIHASIVDCHRNLLSELSGQAKAETTGDDNLRTLELVYAAYQSAEQRASVLLT
ncbi:MAG: Gfo/Idh/MocA family oxidoreductase [Planctomycetales bacterium]|nr:Gfo/Idh/MocA family oxidoreductase [Planctomycetales bacterium]